jgi:hypothetical protein
MLGVRGHDRQSLPGDRDAFLVGAHGNELRCDECAERWRGPSVATLTPELGLDGCDVNPSLGVLVRQGVDRPKVAALILEAHGERRPASRRSVARKDA